MLPDPVLRLEAVRVVAAGDGEPVTLLDGLDWTVRPGERWVVLGPNGAGKTTLLRVASLHAHPAAGRVEVLGHELGRVDVRRLRRRIGLVSPALADVLRPDIPAVDVVMSAREAALETWWHDYGPDDRAHALELLARTGTEALAERRFGTLSSGERQRVLLARSLWGDPGLVLLDERRPRPFGRRGPRRPPSGTTPPTVLVTHHVEEIPPGFTHALLLRDGRAMAAGPLAEVLTADALGRLFGVPLVLDRRDGRWAARTTGGPSDGSGADEGEQARA